MSDYEMAAELDRLRGENRLLKNRLANRDGCESEMPATKNPMQGQAMCRMKAHDFLEQRAKQLEEGARDIRALIGSLPRDLPSHADDALFHLATKIGRESL